MKKYKVIMSSGGGTVRDYITGLTYEEAYQTCEDNNWIVDLGFIWDLYIEEDD